MNEYTSSGNYKTRFNRYKRNLRWKRTMRKQAEDLTPNELRRLAVGQEELENWPVAQNPADPYLEARSGPWSSRWQGGRLMDIYHDEYPDQAVDAIPAGDYDWERSGPFSGPAWHTPPTQDEVNRRLHQWAGEYGDDYARNQLPYM